MVRRLPPCPGCGGSGPILLDRTMARKQARSGRSEDVTGSVGLGYPLPYTMLPSLSTGSWSGGAGLARTGGERTRSSSSHFGAEPVGGRSLEFPRVAAGLLSRGHSVPDIRKILGENVLRVLEQMEQAAVQSRLATAPSIE